MQRSCLSFAVALVVASCQEPAEPPGEAEPAAGATVEPAAPDGADPKHGQFGLKVKFVREKLDERPCDKKLALELSDWLNKAGDYAGTVEHVAAFEKKCGVWHRLLWTAAYAHEQSSQWAEAAAIDTRLIADDPLDSDFWWWRGRAHAEAKQLALAEADFRQSIANRANGFAADGMSKYLGGERPCEAAFAIQRWIERGERVSDWAATRRSEHWVQGGCERLEGKGAHTVKRKKNAPVVEVKLTVDGKSEKMLLSEAAAYVTLSKAFAEKAGIVAGDEITPVYVYGKHVPAKVGTAKKVALGGASAVEVPVAVVEELPGGAAGIVGQSFLWRFGTEDDSTAYKLRAR